ncbi:type II toxin-antitoxin system VapB family antitoxin [Allosaccharopolyspora coralli]|uniref:Type II toxin-antitoxin system VapB family antitoxin n=1 Tax=Allosaccharopolyspora coralli TaxID=2665642 RepID=A0A5Q3QD54_9PSEU|nr:type II toxin-antitoxin system VapB family antitoxin [Allosaccharopolyspora coralli]QGK71114.1 type II toxin-antitoxin system VapB family antitoxin [Allosaccharopolyspora coralli]
MTRTNIDIDDELIANVMDRYRLGSKREAVDFALRRVARPRLTTEALESLHGIGFDLDLEELRGGSRVIEWE